MNKKDKLQTITDKLLSEVESVRDFIKEMIKKQHAYQEVITIPIEEIPLKINNWYQDSAQYKIIKSILEGKDPLEENLTDCIPILWDCEFSYDEYRNIGINDGVAATVASLLETLGRSEDANRAREIIYSDV